MSHEVDLSRNIILINERIPYTRWYDLEDELIATIWIEINIAKNKSILLMEDIDSCDI